jgi:diketogulonate reductase-like aldo/keto reductase
VTSKVLCTITQARDDAVAAGAADAAVAAAEVAAVGAACRASLAKLRLGYLDLYLIHAPFHRDGTPFRARLPALWAAMEALVGEGLVRSVGVSNWREADLRAVLPGAVVRPACNQLEFHPFLQQPALAAFSAAEGVATVAYAPLSPITKGACRGVGGVMAAAEEVAAELGGSLSAAQVLLRWSLQTAQGAITTSTNPQRIASSLAVLDLAPLSAAQVARITDAGREHWIRNFWVGSLGASDPPQQTTNTF